MPQLQFSTTEYDNQQLKSLSYRQRKLKALYNKFYEKVAVIGASTGFNDPVKEFYLKDYPAAQKDLTALLKELCKQITSNIQDGNVKAFDVSKSKYAEMVATLAAKNGWGDDIVKNIGKRNAEALEAFQTRKVNGLGLSQRVWSSQAGTMQQIEMALELGLSQGKGAAALSRDVRQYLDKPNKLFRRVRDKDGILRLSKAAKAYHSGRGVYRSSYKNALRLTATENNMAYRTADHTTRKRLNFVLGFEVHTSNNHPVEDICDELKGKYPKEFKFVGWHPFCRCFTTDVLPSREEFNEWRALPDGEREKYHFKGEVKELPDGFCKWAMNPATTVKMLNAKSLPYFLKDNFVKDGWIADYRSQLHNGLIWKHPKTPATSRLTPMEIGAKRHAARTQATINDIQSRWNLHRLNAMGVSTKVFDRAFTEYGLSQGAWNKWLRQKHEIVTKWGEKELDGFQLLKSRYDDAIMRVRVEFSNNLGAIERVKREASALGVRSKKINAYADQLLAVDGMANKYAIGTTDEFNAKIKRLQQMANDAKAERAEIQRAWTEERNAINGVRYSKMMPDELKAGSVYLEGEQYVFNAEFFDLLKANPKLEMVLNKEGGSYENLNGRLVHIEGKSRLHASAVQRKKVIYHEYGHAIVDQRGLHQDKVLTDMRDAQAKEIKRKRKKNEKPLYYWAEVYDWKQGKYVSKKVQATNKAQYIEGRLRALREKLRRMDEETFKKRGMTKADVAEHICATADALMSLTPSYGWGHGKTYMKDPYLRLHEYMAHAFENTFGGNPVFKKFMPEIYDQMVEYVGHIKEKDFSPNWKL